MTKLPYEKPTIIKHLSGLAGKLGRGLARRTVSRIDGAPISDLIETYGTPLFVFSEYKIRQKYREAHRTFSLRYPKIQL